MSVQQAEDNKTEVPEKIDIAVLADEVYRLLLEELRVEQERQPTSSKRPFRSRRSS